MSGEKNKQKTGSSQVTAGRPFCEENFAFHYDAGTREALAEFRRVANEDPDLAKMESEDWRQTLTQCGCGQADPALD